MAVLSQTAEYALRAVLRLARLPPGHLARVPGLAADLGIPANYLSKTLSQLARAGVLASTRGKRGGFALARPPHRLTLEEVVAPFEEMGRRHCLLGEGACTDRDPCEAHAAWRAISDRMAEFFRNTTVADILRRDDAPPVPVVSLPRPPARGGRVPPR
jgi:Rrf2 family protein